MQGGDKDRARDAMIGATVMTQYNNHMYVIDDIEFGKRVSDTFEGKNGETMTYCDYYHKKWNLTIKDQNQFLMKSVDKKTKRVMDFYRF